MDQTPRLLFISACNMVRLLFESSIIFESGVYFVQCLCGCGYNLQWDTAARSFDSGVYSRAASDRSYTVCVRIEMCVGFLFYLL